MKKIIFTVFLILIVLLSFGCSKEIKSDSADLSLEDSAVTDDSVDEPSAILTTAKDGLNSAESLIKKTKPDAVLVAISGFIDVTGKSDSWVYSFDSIQSSKGYEVIFGTLKETKYSFNKKLNDWVDSSVAAKVCGEGKATLENNVWTITLDDKSCDVDSVTGKKIGELDER